MGRGKEFRGTAGQRGTGGVGSVWKAARGSVEPVAPSAAGSDLRSGCGGRYSGRRSIRGVRALRGVQGIAWTPGSRLSVHRDAGGFAFRAGDGGARTEGTDLSRKAAVGHRSRRSPGAGKGGTGW